MQISTKSTVKAPIEFVYEHFYSNKILSNGSTFVYLKKNGLDAGSTWILEHEYKSFLFTQIKKLVIHLEEATAPTLYRISYEQRGFHVDRTTRFEQTDQGTIFTEDVKFKGTKVSTFLILPLCYPLLKYFHRKSARKIAKKLSKLYQQSIT